MEEKAYKSGFVTLVGRPNVGKSTLMNHLIGQKIAITSSKPQTTRNRIRTVLTTEAGQIVFLDTPGIHKAKNKLGDYMVNAAVHTFAEADVILWLVEPTDYIGAGERHIIAYIGEKVHAHGLLFSFLFFAFISAASAFLSGNHAEADFRNLCFLPRHNLHVCKAPCPELSGNAAGPQYMAAAPKHHSIYCRRRSSPGASNMGQP